MTEENYILKAQEMLQQGFLRKGKAGIKTIVALTSNLTKPELVVFENELLTELKKEALEVSKQIQLVRVFYDENLTIALINDKYIGWAKFNPKDVIYQPHIDAFGNLINYSIHSKYSKLAGRQKAIYRAIAKLLEDEVIKDESTLL